MSGDETLRDFHRRWAILRAPQRPPPAVVEAMRSLLGEREGLALQLGVTPEIALLPKRSLALDWNANMVAIAWPGRGTGHRALVGDWKQLPLRDGSVDMVFGDGSLTMLRWPDEYRTVLERLSGILRPGGRLVLRCFVTPDTAETVEALCGETWEGRAGSFPAFKMRFNMAVAADLGDMNPTSDTIHRAFSARFPDRARLSVATGWTPADIVEIDGYRGSAFIHSYPQRAALLAMLPAGISSARFIETGGYELAERCPLLVLDFA
jgi:SAM-dependent methyltransferase